MLDDAEKYYQDINLLKSQIHKVKLCVIKSIYNETTPQNAKYNVAKVQILEASKNIENNTILTPQEATVLIAKHPIIPINLNTMINKIGVIVFSDKDYTKSFFNGTPTPQEMSHFHNINNGILLPVVVEKPSTAESTDKTLYDIIDAIRTNIKEAHDKISDVMIDVITAISSPVAIKTDPGSHIGGFIPSVLATLQQNISLMQNFKTEQSQKDIALKELIDALLKMDIGI